MQSYNYSRQTYPQNQAQAQPSAHVRDQATPHTPPKLGAINRAPTPRKRHPWRTLLVLLLLVALLFATVRLVSLAYDNNDQLRIRIGSQQSALIDLRQSVSISPYLLGANVFPESGSSSLDEVDSGFMNYGPAITKGLQASHIKLLRFPGGAWGENHVYSFDQLNAFSSLLNRVGADGMLQVQLSNPLNTPNDDLTTRANQAGLIVDYMNHLHSPQRTGNNAHAPFHAIKFWTVGNEPDQLDNPDTGQKFTVAEYVQTFVKYSEAMHKIDPTIKIFGPEISQFYGLGTGLRDAQKQLWMEGFLKGVSTYEQQHPNSSYHLLDGVSFHRYQFDDAHLASALLLSSTGEWNYLLPSLHQLIRQDFGRDLPVALTEVNTNPNGAVPTRGLAALWWADTLGMLMSQQVDYVAFFSAEGVDKPYPLFGTHGLHETAMLRVMQLFAHLQHNFVPVEVQREPVSVYATQDDAHQVVSLLLINKSDLTQLAQVNAENPLFFGLASLAGPWHDLAINLKGYSIELVTLQRNGGATAYSFSVPANDLEAASPLAYKVCGSKTDGLANSITC